MSTRNRTLAELRTEALANADMELDAFITQPYVDGLISRSVEEVHDIIANQAPRILTDYEVLSTTANDELIELSEEVYQIMAIDWFFQDRWRRMRPLDFGQRNRKQRHQWGIYLTPEWQEAPEEDPNTSANSRIRFFPPPQSVFEIRVWFIGFPPKLELDTDRLPYPNGWDHWVVWNTVLQMKVKAEDEITEAKMRRDELSERLLRVVSKKNRTALHVRNVRDVGGDDYWDDSGWY